MQRRSSTRFWVEAVVSGVCATLAVITLFWRDWIEVTGWDPDHHNGSFEWFIVAVLAVVAVALGMLAHRDRPYGQASVTG